MLEPVARPGVALAATHGLPGDTARLETPAARADVTGAWSNTGQTIEIVYRAGDAPVTIVTTSGLRWNGHSVPASHAWHRTTPVSGNVMGQPLSNGGRLKLAAHHRRVVLIEYQATSLEDLPGLGNEVTADVPMPDGPHPVTFHTAAE